MSNNYWGEITWVFLHTIAEKIKEESKSTDLTILGLGLPAAGEESTYAERINGLIETIGTVLLVRNAEQFDLLEED